MKSLYGGESLQVLSAGILIIAVLWVLALSPGRGRRERMAAFSKRTIAHRGLHDNSSCAPENTLAAFGKAVEAGYGFELDVRLTADDRLVVCHDDSLERAAGISRSVSGLTYRELCEVNLFGSDQHVPLFSDVLAKAAGKVPLIVEIKSEDFAGAKKISSMTQALLDRYSGVYCIESFNPAVLFWYKKNRPAVLRGQLAERFSGKAFPDCMLTFLLSSCFFNFLTKPDFIAYDYRHAGLIRFRLIRDLYHPVFAAWTIKSQKQMELAGRNFQIMIFDSFIPEENADSKA